MCSFPLKHSTFLFMLERNLRRKNILNRKTWRLRDQNVETKTNHFVGLELKSRTLVAQERGGGEQGRKAEVWSEDKKSVTRGQVMCGPEPTRIWAVLWHCQLLFGEKPAPLLDIVQTPLLQQNHSITVLMTRGSRLSPFESLRFKWSLFRNFTQRTQVGARDWFLRNII